MTKHKVESIYEHKSDQKGSNFRIPAVVVKSKCMWNKTILESLCFKLFLAIGRC